MLPKKSWFSILWCYWCATFPFSSLRSLLSRRSTFTMNEWLLRSTERESETRLVCVSFYPFVDLHLGWLMHAPTRLPTSHTGWLMEVLSHQISLSIFHSPISLSLSPHLGLLCVYAARTSIDFSFGFMGAKKKSRRIFFFVNSSTFVSFSFAVVSLSPSFNSVCRVIILLS